MAMKIDREQIKGAVTEHLARSRRYRCLILQTRQLPSFPDLLTATLDAAEALGLVTEQFDFARQFDEVGAVSCEEVANAIETWACSRLFVLVGPLHFIDYWSKDVQGRFWMNLAGFSEGEGGIVVLDAYRTDGVIGPFCVVDRVLSGGIRSLKSRLEATQDLLA